MSEPLPHSFSLNDVEDRSKCADQDPGKNKAPRARIIVVPYYDELKDTEDIEWQII